MTYGSAMVTAYALYRSGASDVYEIAPGGGTLVEGATFYWESLLEEQPFDLVQTRTSGSRSPAWRELFVLEFPDHPVANRHAGITPAQMPAGSADTSFCRRRRVGPC